MDDVKGLKKLLTRLKTLLGLVVIGFLLMYQYVAGLADKITQRNQAVSDNTYIVNNNKSDIRALKARITFLETALATRLVKPTQPTQPTQPTEKKGDGS